MTMYYAEVSEAQHVPGAGGGNAHEGEFIQIIEWPISRMGDLLEYNENLTVPASLVCALHWFKSNILPNLAQ